MEPVDDRREQEIQRPQPEYGEDIRREDEKRFRRDAEDRGNRVDRENQIGELDEDQDKKQRRSHLLPVLYNEEVLPVERRRDRQEAANQADDAILLSVELFLTLDRHANTG